MSSVQSNPALELENIRKALDQSAIVAITDQAGIITHVNDQFCSISKYSRAELLGKNHRIINSGYHSAEFFKSLWETISSGKYWEGEICNRAKDGSLYWVHTTISPFLNVQGKPYQYVSIRYEITRRKIAEEQLKILVQKLELSNRELQDFASVAAHDLQEPLRKILTFGDRLHQQIATVVNEESKDYLKRILKSAGRMRTLIDDLLTYSRVTSRGSPFETVDLNVVLKEVLSDLEVRIEQSQGKIQVGLLPSLQADASQMRQLFQNLLANALKFHRPGIPPQIEVRAIQGKDRVEIQVQDQGIGFEEKYLDRIFTIFQRLHGRHEYEGTGVGLAVCRRIVERHRGTITARSTPGAGALFLIELPLNLGGPDEF